MPERTEAAAPAVGIGDLEPHRRELTGYCQRIVGASEAEDAVQETMLRAWRAAAGFDGRCSVRAWLYRIAANACRDLLRGRERRGRLGQRLQASAQVPAAAAGSADPAELAATRDGVRLALAAVLGQLPARQRAALILCEILCWRPDEAARLLGTSAAAVASSLQRARAALARQAGPRDPGGIDAGQLARYQDAFRRYDIATLVKIIQVEASQAGAALQNGRVCTPERRITQNPAAIPNIWDGACGPLAPPIGAYVPQPPFTGRPPRRDQPEICARAPHTIPVFLSLFFCHRATCSPTRPALPLSAEPISGFMSTAAIVPAADPRQLAGRAPGDNKFMIPAVRTRGRSPGCALPRLGVITAAYPAFPDMVRDAREQAAGSGVETAAA